MDYKRRKIGKGAAPYLGSGRHVPVADLKLRLEEREQREAADNRTEAERWLGDPPPGRSALAANGGGLPPKTTD